MGKVVYNACFGGFGLSEQGIRRYAELRGFTIYPEGTGSFKTWWTIPEDERPAHPKDWMRATDEQRAAYNEAYTKHVLYDRDLSRSDPFLVQVVEELGDKASGDFAELRIEEVPSGTAYRIDEYDGNERVMTNDSYDWTVMP